MKYWQKVKITYWFYEGCTWKLHYPSASNKWDENDCYWVAMDDATLWLITFSVNDLEIIK